MPTAGLVWEEPGGAGGAPASSRHLRLAKLTCCLRSLNQLVPSVLLGGEFRRREILPVFVRCWRAARASCKSSAIRAVIIERLNLQDDLHVLSKDSISMLSPLDPPPFLRRLLQRPSTFPARSALCLVMDGRAIMRRRARRFTGKGGREGGDGRVVEGQRHTMLTLCYTLGG